MVLRSWWWREGRSIKKLVVARRAEYQEVDGGEKGGGEKGGVGEVGGGNLLRN